VSDIRVGDHVEWTEDYMSGGKREQRVIEGRVTSVMGEWGRLIVRVPGDERSHHIQPSFVRRVNR
jgi:hypothetical protein